MDKDAESSSDSDSWTVLDNQTDEDFTEIGNSETDDEEKENPFDFNSSLYQQALIDVLGTIKTKDEPVAAEHSDDQTDGISVISDESDENIIHHQQSLSRLKSSDCLPESKDIPKSFKKKPKPKRLRKCKCKLDTDVIINISIGAVALFVFVAAGIYEEKNKQQDPIVSDISRKHVSSQQMVKAELQNNLIEISLNNVVARGEKFGPVFPGRPFNEFYKQDEHPIVEIPYCFTAIQFQKVIDLAARLRDDIIESKGHFDNDNGEYKQFWKTQICNTISSINNNLEQFEDLLLINRRNNTVNKNTSSCSTLSTELHKSANNFLKFHKNIQSLLSRDQAHYMSLIIETTIDDKKKIEKMNNIYALGAEYSRELVNKITDFLSDELKVLVAEINKVDEEQIKADQKLNVEVDEEQIEADQEINVEVDEEEIEADQKINVEVDEEQIEADQEINVEVDEEEIDDKVVNEEEIDDEEVYEYFDKTNDNQNNTIKLLHELFKISSSSNSNSFTGRNFFDRHKYDKNTISINILLKALFSSRRNIEEDYLTYKYLEDEHESHDDISSTVDNILEKLKIISGTSSQMNLVLNDNLLNNFGHAYSYTLSDAILLNKNEIQTYDHEKNQDFYEHETVSKPSSNFVTKLFSPIKFVMDKIRFAEEKTFFHQIWDLLQIISQSSLLKILYRYEYDHDLSVSSILRDRKPLDGGLDDSISDGLIELMVVSRNHWFFVQNEPSVWKIPNKYNYDNALKALDKLKKTEPFTLFINDLKSYLSLCEIESMFDEQMNISLSKRLLTYRRQMQYLFYFLEERRTEMMCVDFYNIPLWSSRHFTATFFTSVIRVDRLIRDKSKIGLINFSYIVNEKLNKEELIDEENNNVNQGIKNNKENEEKHDTKINNSRQVGNDKNPVINSKKALKFKKRRKSDNIKIEKKDSATMDKTPKNRQKLDKKTIKDREEHDRRPNNKIGSTMNKMTKNRQKKRDRKEDMERAQLQNSKKIRKTEKITKEHTNNKKKNHSKNKKKQQYSHSRR